MHERAFRQYLRNRGLKYTKERELILKGVMSSRGHFDPDELHMAVMKSGRRVSKASIYRTLPLLVESGLIEQVEKTEKHAHYESTFGQGHHDHMLCISCGRVIEFYSDALERLQNKICRTEEFSGVSHSLEIKGYCKKCGRSDRASK